MSLRSTVISLVPLDITERKPGLVPSMYHIPASDMKTPSLLKVDTATHFVYMDESRGSLPVKNPSDIVAKSIVDDYCSSQLGIDEEASPALFWVAKDLEIEEVQSRFKIEIMRALIKQKRWFLNVSMMADNDWARYHQHNVISFFQRKVAEIIGWNPKEHEWMAPGTTMKSSPCPYCGISVPEGLPVCSAGHIVNAKLYKEVQESQGILV
jgi:hypothetical protein